MNRPTAVLRGRDRAPPGVALPMLPFKSSTLRQGKRSAAQRRTPPFEQNWDVSIIKNFSLTERQKIRFTADLFDVWNHPVFSAPAFTDVENPAAFGQIISTENNPRIIQFSLKWSF